MTQSDTEHAGHLWGIGKPALQFALLSLLFCGAVGLLTQAQFGMFAPSVLLFALVAGFGLRGLLRSYSHDVLGACNGVTLFRAALVTVLFGAIFAASAPWFVFAIAVVAFALDGVDGWLARRARLTSAFGARFDMEVDALLGAVLALVLLKGGTVGPAILILGFSRYAFVLSGLIWPALQGELPEKLRRKAICVVQIAALIILIFPLTPAVLLMPVAVVAAAALLYSFAVDTRYLLRSGP